MDSDEDLEDTFLKNLIDSPAYEIDEVGDLIIMHLLRRKMRANRRAERRRLHRTEYRARRERNCADGNSSTASDFSVNPSAMSEPEAEDEKFIKLLKWQPDMDGVLTDKAMKEKLEKMGYRCVKYEFEKGTDFPEHTHPMTKMDAITSGRFSVTMYGQTMVMEPGDIVKVPKETRHSAHVVGMETVRFFDSTRS